MEHSPFGLERKLTPIEFNRTFVATLDQICTPIIRDTFAVSRFDTGFEGYQGTLQILGQKTADTGEYAGAFTQLEAMGICLAFDRPMPLVQQQGRQFFDLVRAPEVGRISHYPQLDIPTADYLPFRKAFATSPEFFQHFTEYQLALLLTKTLTQTFRQTIGTISSYSEILISTIEPDSCFSANYFDLNRTMREEAQSIAFQRRAVQFIEHLQLQKKPIPVRDQAPFMVLNLRAVSEYPEFQAFYPNF